MHGIYTNMIVYSGISNPAMAIRDRYTGFLIIHVFMRPEYGSDASVSGMEHILDDGIRAFAGRSDLVF
jgi:hypothetical protein